MKVGFIKLNKFTYTANSFKLKTDIERLLMDRWLDSDTSLDFEMQMHREYDPVRLSILKDKIKAEINFRKKHYGDGV